MQEEEANGKFSNIPKNQTVGYHRNFNGFSTGDQEPGGFKVLNPKTPNPQFNVDGLATVYIGELDWWTTDADVEYEVCKYGNVKELKFYEEKMNGKSKGYCKVLFYDAMSAISCRDGMNGHLFNGRKYVVQCSRPFIDFNNTSVSNMYKKYGHGDQVVVKTNGIVWRKEYVPRYGGRGQGIPRMVGNGVGNYGRFLASPASVLPSSYVSPNGIEGSGTQMLYQGDPVLGYVNRDANHAREGWTNTVKEEDRVLERDRCGSYNRQFRYDRNLKSGRHVPGEKENWSNWRRSSRRCLDDQVKENTEVPREGEHDWGKDSESEYIEKQDRDQHRVNRDRNGDRYIDELFADLSILNQPPELPLSPGSSIC